MEPFHLSREALRFVGYGYHVTCNAPAWQRTGAFARSPAATDQTAGPLGTAPFALVHQSAALARLREQLRACLGSPAATEKKYGPPGVAPSLLPGEALLLTGHGRHVSCRLLI